MLKLTITYSDGSFVAVFLRSDQPYPLSFTHNRRCGAITDVKVEQV